MRVFTLFELQQMPAYGFLSRILSQAELQFYYNTPPEQRAAKLSELVLVRQERGRVNHTHIDFPPTPAPAPTPAPEKSRTQKCTNNIGLFDRVRDMAKSYMTKDFIYKNEVYNMAKLGYRLVWTTDKSRYGYQSKRKRHIGLSKWMLINSNGDYNFWVDTMLHEIAHAIDAERRGTSDHSWQWRSVALAIGCNGNRCGDAKIDPHASKYTIVCPNGHKRASHKYSKKIAMGHQSCGKCSSIFDRRYLLKQIKNY